MKVHSKLFGCSKAKNIRAFSQYLTGIEKDINELGCTGFDVDILSADSSRSFLAKVFLGPDLKQAEETMVISLELYRCPVEILVPLGNWGVTMPFSICVELPVAMTGRAEYTRSALGNPWHYEPKDKQRNGDLKHILPKVTMEQFSQRMGVMYQIQIGQALEPTVDGKTQWIIHSGYEGGPLTGGYRPRIRKYLVEIPKVEALLKKWSSG